MKPIVRESGVAECIAAMVSRMRRRRIGELLQAKFHVDVIGEANHERKRRMRRAHSRFCEPYAPKAHRRALR